MKQSEDVDRYYLSPPQRRALWENEIAMSIVLILPLTVAAFWYGSNIQNVDLVGRVIAPATVGRGVGLAFLTTLFAIVGGAVFLFVLPAAERVRNAHPVRGNRRLAFAAFDGLLVGLVTYQSLSDAGAVDVILNALITLGLGVAAGLIAFVAMHSMVDIPSDQDAPATTR